MGCCVSTPKRGSAYQKAAIGSKSDFKVNPSSKYKALGYKEAIPYKKPRIVIIIGGGLSGLKCAYTLQKHGIDFALIEYSKALGGRIKGSHFAGRYIEEGANWITGTKHERTGRENPIYTLAKSCGL